MADSETAAKLPEPEIQDIQSEETRVAPSENSSNGAQKIIPKVIPFSNSKVPRNKWGKYYSLSREELLAVVKEKNITGRTHCFQKDNALYNRLRKLGMLDEAFGEPKIEPYKRRRRLVV